MKSGKDIKAFLISKLLIIICFNSYSQDSTLTCRDMFYSDTISTSTLNNEFDSSKITFEEEYYSSDFEYLGAKDISKKNFEYELVYTIKVPIYDGRRMYDFFKLGKISYINIVDANSLTGEIETKYLNIKQCIEFKDGWIYRITYTNRGGNKLISIGNYGINLFSSNPQWPTLEEYQFMFFAVLVLYEKKILLVCDKFIFSKVIETKSERPLGSKLRRVK